jgi:outer membrane protein assembly factor BamD
MRNLLNRYSAIPKGPVRRFVRTGAVLVAASVMLISCASTEVDDLVLDDTPADQLYNEALALMKASDYSDATKKFKQIDHLYPYSEYSRKAMVMQTYINYQLGNYQDAVNIGQRYITLHPGSDEAAYAQYLIGQSHFRQIPDVTRDQEATRKALLAMAEVVRLYPTSQYADDARRKVQITRDQLAGKEMQVGRYYLGRRNLIAALNRFKVVITDYQTTRHVEEALARVTEVYMALGVVQEAQTAAAVLGHNFPDSPWYKDAHSLLSKGGYEPSSSSGSWITKAFKGIDVL